MSSQSVLQRSKAKVITNIYDINVNDDIVFSEPVIEAIPGSTLTGRRIRVSTRYPDGKYGDLVLETEELFSFGVKESSFGSDPTDSQKKKDYTMSLCLYDREGPTDKQQEWVDIFENGIIRKIREHVVGVKRELRKHDMTERDIKSPLSRKVNEETGEIEDSSPKWFIKLIVSRKTGAICTSFWDVEGSKLPVDSVMGKFCKARCAIIVDSIYVNSARVSIICKLWEATVEILEPAGSTRLLKPKKPPQETVVEQAGADYSDEEETYGDVVVPEEPPVVEVPLRRKTATKKKI
jgi:hypothetical protein